MPKGVLVLAIGGTGRGVMNHLKRSLEQEFGSPENAGVVLYCIDGPLRDQYVLPGDYQLDTSEDSTEFYRLTNSPVGAITNIAQGRGFNFVDEWLTHAEASKVPTGGINPQDGFGGERVPSRVNLFLESDNLVPVLNELIARARSFIPRGAREGAPGSRVSIFLVGSHSGGTGSGQLLDLAHLLHTLKGRDRLIGVIPLPNSFNSVISTPAEIVKRDAKAFTGIRELHRSLDASTDSPVRVRYSNNINVSNPQLFDLCFLIDGQGANIDLSDTFPLYGFVPAVADTILAMIKDSQHIEPNVIGWIAIIGGAPSSERFSSSGVHTFIYPDKDLIETFSLRFAHELYNQLLTIPPDKEDEGRNLALGVLSGTKLGEMAVDLEKGKGIPSRPSEFNTFRLKIATGIGDPPFPLEPVLMLDDVVKTSGIFRPHTNATVMQDCQNETARYIGAETDTKPQTVWGWINYQSDRIGRKFADDLTRSVTDIFYELRENKLQPRQLDQKPYTIVVVGDFLRMLLDSLKKLKDTIDAEYRSQSQKVISGVQTDILTLQRQQVDGKAKALTPLDGKDKGAQGDYIVEYQKLLELQVWDALMKGASNIAQRLYELANALWIMVGDPAQGWISYLENSCRYEVEKKLSSLISTRSRFAEVKVRRYFPSPNGRAEQAMFEQFVLNAGILRDLLRDMNWTFESARPNQLGFEPKSDVESYQLILHLPLIPGFDKERYKRGLTEVVTGKFRQLELSTHIYEEIVQFGKNRLNQPLSALTILDAIHYDYLHEWAPEVLSRGLNPTVDAYVDGLTNELAQKSSPLLSQQAAVTGVGVVPDEYCLSAFRNVLNAPANSVDDIATAFYNRLSALGLIHNVPSISKHIFRVNYEHRIPLRNWRYYPTSLGNYFSYLSVPATPVHLAPHERNASVLERYLIQHKLMPDAVTSVDLPGVGVVPVRPLDVSVVRHLGNMDNFKTFTLAYAFDLIDVEMATRIEEPDRYYVEIQTVRGKQQVHLGPVWGTNEVLTNFLAPNPQAEAVRKSVDEKWDALFKAKQVVSDWRPKLAEELREKARGISFAPVPAGSSDPIHRDDLKLAMQAVLYQLAERL